MARATYQKAGKDYPAWGVKKGDMYYRWGFRFGGEHGSLHQPKPSQLTQSPFKSEYYSIQEALAEISTLESVEEAIQEAVERAQQLGEQCQEGLDNMPDGLQEGDTGQMIQERIDAMESWSSDLENITVEEIPEELDEDQLNELGDNPSPEEKAEKLQEVKDQILEELKSEIEGCDPGCE